MTVPHYGKREPGLLTAVSPGDTLYFNFGSYNDSGDSEAMTGLAITDIEVIKNGSATVRATDSGYSLISDTGQVGDRVGLHRFSVQLFNTADDASFYAVGSWYQVFVDSVTIDGKTVRFWCGSFEIGRNRVDVREIVGDTGSASQLAGYTATVQTYFPLVLADVFRILTDTGAASKLRDAFTNGFNDTGINDRLGRIGFDVDTGLRAQLSDVDTGLHDTIADLDTGLRGILALADTGKIATAVWAGDTGIRTLLGLADTGKIATAVWAGDTGIRAMLALQDTGKVATAVWAQDTGLRDLISDVKVELDTGLRAILALADTGKIATAVWAGDTGIRDLISDVKVELDTGLRAILLLQDTGKVATAVWAQDTGLRDLIADVKVEIDTGLRAQIALQDTGFVANAVWNALRSAHTTAGSFGESDTGVNDRLGRIGFDVDTGLRAQLSDVDTGLHDAIADLDTGIRDYIDNTDTGLRANISVSGTTDTGLVANAAAIRAKTDSLTFTKAGEVDSNVQSVNDVTVSGTGASGDEWGP